MSGRMPLAVEATIARLAGTVAVQQWAWGGDSSLSAYGLLRWRDHTPTVVLHAPADRYDPPALVWALRRQLDVAPTVSELRNATVVRAPLASGDVTATLQRDAVTGDSTTWAQTTTAVRSLPHNAPQPVLVRTEVVRQVLDGWLTSDHRLSATIDALTIADQHPPERLLALCEQLRPGRGRQAVAERLTLLQAIPDLQLRLKLRPEHHAAMRLAADRLEQALHNRRRAAR